MNVSLDLISIPKLNRVKKNLEDYTSAPSNRKDQNGQATMRHFQYHLTGHHKPMPWMAPVPSSPFTTNLSTEPANCCSDLHLHNKPNFISGSTFPREHQCRLLRCWGRWKGGGRGLYTNSWMRWQLWMMPIWLEPYWSQNGCVYAGPEGSEWWKDNCKKTINYRIKFPHPILPGTWQTNFHISIRFLVGWGRIKVNETT